LSETCDSIIIIQDGGKTSEKASGKLACKMVFSDVFTSEESPMLLVWPKGHTRRCRPKAEEIVERRRSSE
jgi:hypothetical protein